MGDAAPAVPIPSPSLRLLRLSKPPATAAAAASLPLELDESDVIWSGTDLSPRSPVSDDPVLPPSPPPRSAPPNPARRAFVPMKSGLSAALAEEDQTPIARWPRAAALVPARPDLDETRLFGKSMPVNVPAWPKRRGIRGGEAAEEEEVAAAEEREEEEEMVPPHVMVARSHVMTFSVFEGAGRTLKGRDLRRVRNAVMRQTGFID